MKVRGQEVSNGTTRVAANGYSYTKVDGEWRLTHHLIAEEKIGRPLTSGERVVFGKKGKKDLSPDNIIVVPKGKGSTRRRIAQLDSRIEELTAQKKQLEEELRLDDA